MACSMKVLAITVLIACLSCVWSWNTHVEKHKTVPYGNALYYFSEFKATWAMAKSICLAKGGHLASVHSKSEHVFLTSEIKKHNLKYPWLGGNDIKKEGAWVWSDQTKMDYKNWYAGEPNNKGSKGVEDCLQVWNAIAWNDKPWNDRSCDMSFDYVCKIIYHNGNRYFLSTDKKDFSSAENHCVKLGGHLTSIHSKHENDFLNGLITERGNKPLWIGLNDLKTEGKWQWTDGSTVYFTHWRKNEPNNLKNEDCTLMNWHVGGWNDGICNDKFQYICKF